MIVKHSAYSALMLGSVRSSDWVCLFFKQTNNRIHFCLHVVSRINSLSQKLYIWKKQRKYIFKKALEANIWKIFENQKNAKSMQQHQVQHSGLSKRVGASAHVC